MKKSILILLISCLFLFAGCHAADTKQLESGTSSDAEFIEMEQPNLFTMDTERLYKVVADKIGAEDNGIAMPFLYENPAAEILFVPDGTITYLNFFLSAKTEESNWEYKINSYRVSNVHRVTPPDEYTYPDAFGPESQSMSGLNVHYQEKGNYSKDTFSFDFKEYENFTSWIGSADLESAIEKYQTDPPDRYLLTTGLLKNEDVNNPNAHIIWLNGNSNKLEQIDGSSLAPRDKTAVYFGLIDKTYCAILPYYKQDGTLKGFREQTVGEGDHAESYIANNAIVFLFDKDKPFTIN